MIGLQDIILKPDRPRTLLLDKHEAYLKHYAKDETAPEQIMAEYLKMSGIYWGINALYLMKRVEDQSEVAVRSLEFIKQCQNDDGGFAAAPKHDSHLLHTLSAVQVLVILQKCNKDYIDVGKCVNYVRSLQQQDGSFFGDKWGEVDTRFTMCALATLRLLNKLEEICLDKAVEFVMSCYNQIDGGFGRLPGSESHTAYVYCCVGSLAIADKLHLVDIDLLAKWLSERQLPSGGLNGRPQKLPDLCYSWWCLASMKMIDKMHMIDHKKLLDYILACQDDEQGGLSDRPGNWVDPYHTVFGLASISLICYHFSDTPSKEVQENTEFHERIDEFRTKLRRVNPVLCMPEDRLDRVTK